MTVMNDDLRAAATVHGGCLSTTDLLALGWSSRAIRSLLVRGVLVRIRHGAYALADDWARLDPVAQHLLRARAVLRRHDDRVALCGVTSLLARGIDVWDVDLSLVDVVRLDGGSGRREAGVRHHVGQVDATSVERHDGMLLAPAGSAVWQAMCRLDVEHGLVVLDSSLHRGVIDRAEVDEAAERGAHHRGALHARITHRLGDGRAEKPSETRSRYLCYQFSLPRPRPQLPIIDESGHLVGYADLGWELWSHVAEFDGRVKYSGTLPGAEDPSAVVWAEKRREDAIRRLGWGVTRLVWDDLRPDRRAATAARLRAELEASRAMGRRRAG